MVLTEGRGLCLHTKHNGQGAEDFGVEARLKYLRLRRSEEKRFLASSIHINVEWHKHRSKNKGF